MFKLLFLILIINLMLIDASMIGKEHQGEGKEEFTLRRKRSTSNKAIKYAVGAALGAGAALSNPKVKPEDKNTKNKNQENKRKNSSNSKDPESIFTRKPKPSRDEQIHAGLTKAILN
ncbi:hypothetical protein Mgra_00006954 [Meloidogyne graminicola]|uniref:Uncharacterized protein n=1 Tax=Meloidogyne graminicola TaxID=189291 RepID=A0A8S9ZKD6_9BILA|nr:hypothetical protein Mgra_00006954 [Meloidogyne graminicola]